MESNGLAGVDLRESTLRANCFGAQNRLARVRADFPGAVGKCGSFFGGEDKTAAPQGADARALFVSGKDLRIHSLLRGTPHGPGLQWWSLF